MMGKELSRALSLNLACAQNSSKSRKICVSKVGVSIKKKQRGARSAETDFYESLIKELNKCSISKYQQHYHPPRNHFPNETYVPQDFWDSLYEQALAALDQSTIQVFD